MKHISEAVKKVMEKAEKAQEDKVKQYNKEYQEKYGVRINDEKKPS